jgi:hypothetical protein
MKITSRDKFFNGTVLRIRKRESNMKLRYFLLWLAGGGLVLLQIFFCTGLLKLSQVHEDAEDQRVWELLLRSGRS